MTESVRKRPGGRSARVRVAVLTATLAELAATGYGALSLEGIARRAGVNKTTLYRRWGSREELVLDAMLERGEQHVPIPDTGSLRGDLLAYGKAIVASMTPDIEAAARTVASAGGPESKLREIGIRFWRARYELAREIVDRAIARAEVPPDTDPHLVIESLLAPIYFRVLMTGERLTADVVEPLVDFIVDGATARAGEER